MAGLLDKAKDVVKDGDLEGIHNYVGTPEDANLSKETGSLLKTATLVDKGGSASKDKTPKEKPASKSSVPSAGNDTNAKIGFISGFISLVLAVYFVWDLANWEGVIPLGLLLLAWGLTSWGFKQKKGEWNQNTIVAVGLTFLVIAAIPYLAAFSWEGGNVRASLFEIDEANDMLSFTLYNTVGEEATASISVKGEDVWTKDGIEGNNEGISTVKVPLADIYRGSSIDANDHSALTYILSISAGTYSWEGEITPELLDRTITAVGADMLPVTEQDESGNTGGGTGHTDTDHLGIQMKLGLGKENSDLQRSSNPVEGEWDAYIQEISSDYTFTITIDMGGSEVWNGGSTFSVNGDSMTSSKGSNSISYGWLDLELNGMESKDDINGQEIYYIPRSDFYDGDGCYKTTITITHIIPGGDSFDTFSSTNGFEYFWEENENRDADDDYKAAVKC
jgi:hypothetical protein